MVFKSTRQSRRHRTPQPEKTSKDAFFQPKLRVGKPDDQYEREADAVADQVVSGRGAAPGTDAKGPAIQTMPDSKMEEDRAVQEKSDEGAGPQVEEEPVQLAGIEEEEPVQRMDGEEEENLQMMGEEETKSTSNKKASTAGLSQQLKTRAGKGRFLSGSAKQQMEGGFGRDFSDVNIHTDATADAMNRQLGAKAFARGKDIYFKSGQYNPETTAGQRLLAHELTHTVQQGGTTPKSGAPSVQRDAETDAAGNHTGNYVFRNNIFFRRVRTRLADGTLTNEELIELKQDAIRRNGTVQHAELLLMAAALDPANATRIHAHRHGNFVLPASNIRAAHRQHVQDVDRGALSQEVLDARAARDATAAGSADRESAETDIMIAAGNQIESELEGSSFAPKGIELLTQQDVPLDLVLEAMLNAASDSTAGDKVMAGIAYVVAKQYNHPMASQLRNGALQVDALIPRVYRRIVGGGDAAYQYSTDRDVLKADTLYLPTNLSLIEVTDRALIVHELTHASDDFSQGGTRQEGSIDLEVRAYTAQAKYILDQFRADLPHPDSDAMHSASGQAKSDKAHYWAYLTATKANISHYEATLRSILTASPLSKSATDITTDLGKSAADIDTELRNAIINMKDSRGRNLYNASGQTTLDGSAGQFFN